MHNTQQNSTRKILKKNKVTEKPSKQSYKEKLTKQNTSERLNQANSLFLFSLSLQISVGWRLALGVAISVGHRDRRWALDVEIAVEHGDQHWALGVGCGDHRWAWVFGV